MIMLQMKMKQWEQIKGSQQKSAVDAADADDKARRQRDEAETMKSKREADDDDDTNKKQLDQLLTKLLAVPKVASITCDD